MKNHCEIHSVSHVRLVFFGEGDGTYQDDLSTKKRRVERWYMAWCLAIVFRQTDQEHNSYCPHQASYYNTDYHNHVRVCNGGTASRRGMLGGFRQFRSPVPQSHNVDLLRALDDTGAVDPRCNRSTT